MAEVINAIGRRKSAVARVYLTEGTGKITINKKLRSMTSRLTSTVAVSQVRARLSASLSLAHSLRLTQRIRRTLRITASSLATLVRLSVRSQVVQRLVVASSSLSVNTESSGFSRTSGFSRFSGLPGNSLVSKPARSVWLLTG